MRTSLSAVPRKAVKFNHSLTRLSNNSQSDVHWFSTYENSFGKTDQLDDFSVFKQHGNLPNITVISWYRTREHAIITIILENIHCESRKYDMLIFIIQGNIRYESQKHDMLVFRIVGNVLQKQKTLYTDIYNSWKCILQKQKIWYAGIWRMKIVVVIIENWHYRGYKDTTYVVTLTHCSLVTPYGDNDLGQHCLR